MEKTLDPKYEAPRAVRLDDRSLAYGECQNGTTATSNCGPSGGSAVACFNGISAGASCLNDGSSAHGCQTGTSPSFSCTGNGASVAF